MKNYRKANPGAKEAAFQLRLKNALDLTFAKVAAHIHAPQQYAMPTGSGALEHKILRFYQLLNQKGKTAFLEKTNLLITQSAAANRQRFEDLLDIDITSSGTMLDKIKAHPLPEKYHFTQKESEALNAKVNKFNTSKKSVLSSKILPQQAVEPQTLSLFLETIRCKDPQDVLKDEIFYAGFTLNAVGVNEPIPFSSAGKFKKNDEKQLQVKLRDFDLQSAGFFPQDFLVGLFVFEKDSKKDDEIIKFTMELLQDIGLWVLAVADAIAIAALVVTLGGSMPAGFALAIVALSMGAVGLLIIGIVSLVNGLRLSEVSIQVTDLFRFQDATIKIGERVLNKHAVTINGSLFESISGNYEVTFRWERTA